MTTAAIRGLFRPELGTIYLDAATYGLPPRPTVEAMARALTDWQSGRADWRRDWELAAEEARGFFAALIGATVEEIALVPTVSVGMGPMVASLRAGDEVVVPDDEFVSVLVPLLADRSPGRGGRLDGVCRRACRSAVAQGCVIGPVRPCAPAQRSKERPAGPLSLWC